MSTPANLGQNFASRASYPGNNQPITAPIHSWLTSPARSHPNAAQAKELPLHLIQVILSHLDNVSDLARITRTSRLFYYMTLPRLYEEVTLRSYSEIKYVDGRPEGYGGGSPFAMGLNTLVSRTFTDYVQKFRLVGEWREHDIEEYKQGRVPDNSMVLQVIIRAVLDKMKNLEAFAWELNTPPLHTVYQGLIHKQPGLTSLTLRCQSRRIPRPTTIIPPLQNLRTLIVYDIDPLCYPDDISLLLLGSKKLRNLKLHWNPRMRENGEESVNLLSLFGRCMAAKHKMRIKRFAIYNLYARFMGDGMDDVMDENFQEEATIMNSFGSSNPLNVFVDSPWLVRTKIAIPTKLKMFRSDNTSKDNLPILAMFNTLERLFFVQSAKEKDTSTMNSTTASPITPAPSGGANGNAGSNTGTPKLTEKQCRNLGSEYLAVIQSHHRGMRHLLLSNKWQLSDDALFRLCQSLPNLEQLAFSSTVPPLGSLRQIMSLVPKLYAIRMLVTPGSELADFVASSVDNDMHRFAIATEFWKPEYRNLKYLGWGENLIWKLGDVYYPPKPKEPIPEGQENSMNAKRAGPIRRIEQVRREDVQHIDIWGMDTVEFDPKFP